MALADLRGSIVALATPFHDGAVDDAALEALVHWHLEQGSMGVSPVGTTGESPTVSHEEHEAIVARVVKTVGGRVPVVAGAGSNSTAEAIRFTRHAAAVGADAALVVAPYYNRPTQEGLFQHFKAVHDAADIPIILYNVPPRSAVDLELDTVKRLAELPRIVGIKDATADLARPALTRAAVGEGFIQLSGEDATAVGFNAMGGVGCISVTANVAPALCADMQKATLAGDYAAARAIQDRLIALHRALFLESSPAPTKYALSLLNRARNEIRAPLVPVTEGCAVAVRDAMRLAGLLED